MALTELRAAQLLADLHLTYQVPESDRSSLPALCGRLDDTPALRDAFLLAFHPNSTLRRDTKLVLVVAKVVDSEGISEAEGRRSAAKAVLTVLARTFNMTIAHKPFFPGACRRIGDKIARLQAVARPLRTCPAAARPSGRSSPLLPAATAAPNEKQPLSAKTASAAVGSPASTTQAAGARTRRNSLVQLQMRLLIRRLTPGLEDLRLSIMHYQEVLSGWQEQTSPEGAEGLRAAISAIAETATKDLAIMPGTEASPLSSGSALSSPKTGA